MKKLLLISFLFLTVLSVHSRHIDKTEAINIANMHFSKNSDNSVQSKSATSNTIAFVGSNNILSQNNTSTEESFYIFNNEDNKGFIIIAADTRVNSVLAYSNTGNFDTNNIPANMKEWLLGYSNEISEAINNIPETYQSTSVQGSSNTVAPLLGTIAFNQEAPYNNSCPGNGTSNTVTGCVATAMAQIMKYHQYPTQGTGSNAYNSYTYNFDLWADFGNTTYDWANMLPTYDNTETEVQKTAIATLLSHAGISVNMDYGYSGSSAMGVKSANALYDYFGYDAGVQAYYRKYFTREVWVYKIKTELDHGRPLIYSGVSESYGHAFVCDGYDEDDFFHINWGWGGSSNGYFKLSALSPSNQSNSNKGFNFNQEMVIGIQPAVNGSVHAAVIGMKNMTPSNEEMSNEPFYVEINNLYNLGRFAYNNELRLAIYSNDALVEYLDTIETNSTLGEGFGDFYIENIDLTNYAVGNYQLKLLYKNENDLFVPVLVDRGGNGTVEIEITDNNELHFTIPNTTPELVLSGKVTKKNPLYNGVSSTFELTVTNTSDTLEYYSQIGIQLADTVNNEYYQDIQNMLVQLSPGESKTFQLSNTINLDSGTYILKAYYDTNNDELDLSFPDTPMEISGDSSIFAVNKSQGAPELDIYNSTYTISASIYEGDSIKLSASLFNQGGVFSGSVCAQIFTTSGSYENTIGVQDMFLMKDSNQTVILNDLIDLDAGSYYTKICYKPYDSYIRTNTRIYFDVHEPLITGIEKESTQAFRIINTPTNNMLNVKLPHDAISLTLYSFEGKVMKKVNIIGQNQTTINVNNLQPAPYLLLLETTSERQKLKFIKN